MDVNGGITRSQLNKKRKEKKREKGRQKRIKHRAAVDVADISDEEKEWKRWNHGTIADLTKEQREPLRKLVNEALEILSTTNSTTMQVIFGTVMTLNRGNPVQWRFSEVRGMLYLGVRLGFYTLTGCRFHLAEKRADPQQGTSAEESLAALDAQIKVEDDENAGNLKAENSSEPPCLSNNEIVKFVEVSRIPIRHPSPVKTLAPDTSRMDFTTIPPMHFPGSAGSGETFVKPEPGLHDPGSATAKLPVLDFTEDWTASIQSTPSAPVIVKRETVSEPVKRPVVNFSDDWTASLDSSASSIELRQSRVLPFKKPSAASFIPPPAIATGSETRPQSSKTSGFFKRFLGQKPAS